MGAPSPSPAQAVIVAAGRSSRMGPAAGERKPFRTLGTIRDTPVRVLEATCAALGAAPSIVSLVVVVHVDDRARAEALLSASPWIRVACQVVVGGAERSESVAAGVAALGPDTGWVAIHDGARPLVSPSDVEAVVAAARAHGAALLALAVRDTLKRSEDGDSSEETVDRANLFAAQTPQVFERARFEQALLRAREEGFSPTDDAALWERFVGPVRLVPGDPRNLKITTPEDLALAALLYAQRLEETTT